MAALVLAAPAAAQSTGGSAPEAPREAEERAAPPLSSPPPGVVVRRPSKLRRVRCLSECAEAGAVGTGSRLRLRGRRLKRTYEVIFLGAEGDADDVSTAPMRPKRRHRIDVEVPLGAASGPVLVADRDGQRSEAVAPLQIQPPTATLLSAGPSVEVQTTARRAFFDAKRPAEVTYVVHGSPAARVLIELVRERDDAVVASWQAENVPAEAPQTVEWDGTAGGHVQRQGRYSFRVSAVSANGVQAVSAQTPRESGAPDPAQFVFLRHAFPVRGPHGYGEYAASFGGGRGHQGQDVFAACGTPLVAARGGRVKFKQYHSAAGHYIVIDGKQTGVDYAYMHLRQAALVDEGDRVRTGQLIGYVGDTGRATGCHLHLEMWSSPGWYEGGQPFDPLPELLAWDKKS